MMETIIIQKQKEQNKEEVYTSFCFESKHYQISKEKMNNYELKF